MIMMKKRWRLKKNLLMTNSNMKLLLLGNMMNQIHKKVNNNSFNKNNSKLRRKILMSYNIKNLFKKG